MYEILEKDPQDWDTYKILADVVEDLGHSSTAECMRWQAEEKLYPYCYEHDGDDWSWFKEESWNRKNVKPLWIGVIEEDLYTKLKGHKNRGDLWKEYHTFIEATKALHLAYGKIKHASLTSQ